MRQRIALTHKSLTMPAASKWLIKLQVKAMIFIQTMQPFPLRWEGGGGEQEVGGPLSQTVKERVKLTDTTSYY